MTILTAAQAAIAKLVGRRPAAVVSSTDEICVEITALAQEAAVEIAKACDWQELTEFYEITADGEASAYPFPSDYDRMVQASEIFDPNNWCWGYHHVPNYSEWILYEIRKIAMLTPGIWTIRKNQFHFMPTPAAGQKAIFPYISKNIFLSQNEAPKDTITSDSDSFVLDERLLTLSLIWKYKAMKGLDYQQEVDDYNIALSQEMTRNKGARTIRKGCRFRTIGAYPAWPWPLGGV
ncbi:MULTISPECIES: hypothetical protein [Chelativorans]|uniref:phage adaptor protein n=1 Tax=Chelativorans TaxID=449972 RepID=UPI00140CDE29|nr:MULTISPECIES: hypothetical protein [Chelativorans]